MLQSTLDLLSFYARRLIVRVSLYALIALFSVIGALFIGQFIPSNWVSFVGADALETVLTTLASSMLAVTTFSLTILSSAFRAAESSATPRAVFILREDQTTHRILSVFIGAFLFSLTGIILLATPFMTTATRFVLFLVAIVIVLQVIIAVIRWIHHIEQLGSLVNILDCLQAKVRPVIKTAFQRPSAGAHVLEKGDEERGKDGVDIRAGASGYVTMIALDALQSEAESCEGRIFIHVRAGDFVHEGELLLRVDGLKAPTEMRQRMLREMVLIGSARSFEQDAEFGLIVMSEVATRALSSGVNDPQTAVDVVHRLGAVLLPVDGSAQDPEDALCHDRLWHQAINRDDFFKSSFDVIAREGGEIPEVRAALNAALDRLGARLK